MEYMLISNLKIVEGQDALTESQRKQFRQVMMEGFKDKFRKTLQNDTDRMLKIVEVWIRHKFMPMDETYCAVDGVTGDVLAIILMNNFKESGFIDTLLCFIKWIGITGFKKACDQSLSFLRLDHYNKRLKDPYVVAEIYLVATRENLRGQGIGTELLKYALEDIKKKCKCGLQENCTCKIKLLAFGKDRPLKLYGRLGFKQVSTIPTPDMKKAFAGEQYDSLLWMERPVFQ